MRVSILSSEFPENACSRIRLRDVLKKLQPDVSFTWTGLDPEIINSRKEVTKLFESDIFIIQRSFPRPSTIDLLDVILFESGKPVIYETDDLLTETPPDHIYHSAFAPYGPLMLSFMANCEAITTSTSALKTKYEPFNPHCHVLGNLLNESLWYQPFTPTQYHPANRPLNIGFCGSPTHKSDMECVEEALERIYGKYHEQVKFSFFGCITERLKRLPNMVYQEKHLRNYSEYPKLLRSLEFDIGLAPLEDIPFNLCKSNIKYLEYAACGIPGVYSNLAPYNDSVINGVTGLLTENTPDGWFDSISSLIENPIHLRQIAISSYEDVWSRFSLSSNAKSWLTTYEKIIDANQHNLPISTKKRATLEQLFWQQTVNYERQLIDLTANLNQARNQLEWLENQSIIRTLRSIKSVFSSHK